MRILSTLAVKGVLSEILGGEGGPEIVYAPTQILMQQVARGEGGDIAILTESGIDALLTNGVLAPGSKRDLAISSVGFAVRAGAPKPELTTPAAVRDYLLAVPSLCYSASGASGLHFARVIRELGIADAVNAKATIIPSGFTAEAVADGRCVVAVQQLSELLIVPGIEIAGPLPEALQESLTFSGGVFAGSARASEALEWLAQMQRRELAPLYQKHGLRLAP